MFWSTETETSMLKIYSEDCQWVWKLIFITSSGDNGRKRLNMKRQLYRKITLTHKQWIGNCEEDMSSFEEIDV